MLGESFCMLIHFLVFYNLIRHNMMIIYFRLPYLRVSNNALFLHDNYDLEFNCVFVLFFLLLLLLFFHDSNVDGTTSLIFSLKSHRSLMSKFYLYNQLFSFQRRAGAEIVLLNFALTNTHRTADLWAGPISLTPIPS